MRSVAILCAMVGLATAQSYTAINLQPPGSPIYFANVMGLTNKGEVLGDACIGTCSGSNGFPAVWSNGAITPLPLPHGYAYLAQPAYYAINNSGTVVGTVQVPGATTNPTHVVVWTSNTPAVLPDAPIPNACSGAGCTCSTNGSSSSFGITAAGHVVGSTSYPPYTLGGPGCSAYWVYNGATFRLLPVPIPAMCTSPPLPPGYGNGVNVGFGAAINNEDVVLQTLDNVSCGPPYVNPGFPAADPFLIQPNGTTSFLGLGSLSAATGTAVNDLGDVLGFTDFNAVQHLVGWNPNGVGVTDFGQGGFGHLNQAGDVLYLTRPCIGCGGVAAMWQHGVSIPVQLPAGVDWRSFAPTAFNDAGQFVMSSGASNYLLKPLGACASDVTSQFQVTRTGFRYNHSTGLFVLTGSVTNTSGSSVPGPVSLVLDNLPAGVTPLGITGTTLCAGIQGSPYLNVGNLAAGEAWLPGASVSGGIDFANPGQTGISYTFRVLAGGGNR